MPDWLKDNRTIPTATLVAVWVLCVFDWLGSGFLRALRVSRFSEWIHGGVFSVTTFVAILFFFRAWDQCKGEGKAVRLWIVASIAWFPCWQVDTFFADLEGYPDVAPKLYVLQPTLRCHDGSLLSELGTSSTMHVLAPNDHGHVQVCHYNDRFWRSSLTLYKVLMKTRVWLEAYERHLRHGEPVEHYLGHM